MKLSKEHLDELTAGYTTPEQIESLYSQMLQQMINRSLEAQMQAHLGHQRHGRSVNWTPLQRTGARSTKRWCGCGAEIGTTSVLVSIGAFGLRCRHP